MKSPESLFKVRIHSTSTTVRLHNISQNLNPAIFSSILQHRWAGLGWAWFFSLHLQVMRAPRDIFQLADTVRTDSGRDREELTEQTMTESVWIRSFLQTPKMRDSRERTELLYFLVFTSVLAAVEKTDKERTIVLLESIRARFFTDSQFYQANIALADIHNVINDIFR